MTSTSPLRVPGDRALLRDVRWGLSRPQKELPPKYFYDHRGSMLFEAITRLPEYYLTRAERRVLRTWMPAILRDLAPTTLVELGAGSGEKTRIILRAMRAAGRGRRYIPIDVSAEFLDQSAARLRSDLPWLAVEPVVGDFTRQIDIPQENDGPVLFAFLGSTIGNFTDAEGIAILRSVRQAMRGGDRFLLGADLRTKPVSRIERAYNDTEGITAEFNRNILHVLNRELDAGFDPARFEHRAAWSWAHHRIEMHLVSRGTQRVPVPALGAIVLRDGESIRTEICCKYDEEQLARMFAAAGLAARTWCVDPHDKYAIVIAAPADDIGWPPAS